MPRFSVEVEVIEYERFMYEIEAQDAEGAEALAKKKAATDTSLNPEAEDVVVESCEEVK